MPEGVYPSLDDDKIKLPNQDWLHDHSLVQQTLYINGENIRFGTLNSKIFDYPFEYYSQENKEDMENAYTFYQSVNTPFKFMEKIENSLDGQELSQHGGMNSFFSWNSPPSDKSNPP